MLATVAFGGASAPAADFNIDPYNFGKGDWIYYLTAATNKLGGAVPSVVNVPTLMTFEKSQGMQYIIIKAGTGAAHFPSSGNKQVTTSVINAAHSAGLKIYAYTRSDGIDVPGEIALATYYLDLGCDGFVIDAEAEWESHNLADGPAKAIQLCSGIRAAYPTRYLGHSPFWKITSHSTFPYKEFGYYCDNVMPQDYWYVDTGQQRTPQQQVDQMETEWNSWQNGLSGQWTNALKPLVPAASTWNSSMPASQITDFITALKNTTNSASWKGYKGVNFWRADLKTAAMWAAVAANNQLYKTNEATFSAIGATQVTDASANIYWESDISTHSIVEYGLTTNYTTQVVNNTMEVRHLFALANLDASTTYHFRVKGTNFLGQLTVSADQTFTTPAEGIVTDVYVESRLTGGALNSNPPYTDNSDFANSTLKSTASGLTGTGSRYGSAGTPTFSVTPSLVLAGGKFDVYITHGAAASISDDIVVGISQSGCTGLPATTTVFREPGANTWELVGRLTNNAGVSSPTLTFAYSSGTLNSSSRMYSDSIRFVPVPTAPAVTNQPANLTVNFAGTATFGVKVSGSGPLTYQWQRNGGNLTEGGRFLGVTNKNLSISSVNSGDAGNFTCIVTNIAGAATSTVAVLTVVDPVIVSQTTNQTADLNANAQLQVSALGTATLAYRWYRGGALLTDDGKYSGTGTSALTIGNAQLADATNYTAIVTNAFGAATSAVIVLNVKASPVITSSPADRTNQVGTAATFAVGVNGASPLFYQWRKNGGNLGNSGNTSGALSSSLTISNVVSGDTATYTVVVSNAYGSATSTLGGTLTILTPPALTSQAATRTNVGGALSVFTVTATGTGPLTYQWRKDGVSLADGGNLAGASTATLNVSNVSQLDAGAYSVAVANTISNVTSTNAVLVVNNGLTETNIVESHTAGGVLTGNPPFEGSGLASSSLKSTAPGLVGTGSEYAGSGTPFFRVKPTLLVPGGKYLVEITHGGPLNISSNMIVSVSATGGTGLPVTNTAFNFLSNNNWVAVGTLSLNTGVSNPVVTFTYFSGFLNGSNRFNADAVRFTTVGAPPVITSQPVSSTNTVGGSLTLSAVATGSGPLAYQWRKNGTAIGGATARQLAFTDLQLTNTAAYTLVVSNAVGLTTSVVANVTVLDVAPAITGEPGNQTVSAESTANFAVEATGTSLAYRWYRNGTPLSDTGRILGSTASALAVQQAQPSDAGNYTVVITNSSGSVTSIVATLTVIDVAAFTSQPVTRTNNAGTTATFTAVATGVGPIHYQWRKNGTDLTEGGNVSGVTNTTLTLSNVLDADEGAYSVLVSNPGGTTPSTNATLTVIDPVITGQPVNSTNAIGTTATFTVTAAGSTPLTYQWKKGTNVLADGVNISGAITATLTLTNVQPADAASYSVTVFSDSGGTATSTAAALVVLIPPAITVPPVSVTNGILATVNFSVTATGTGPLAYQWRKDGTNLSNGGRISGVTGTQLTLSPTALTDAGGYTVVVTNVAGSVTSSVAQLVISGESQPPVVKITAPKAALAFTGSSSVAVSGTATDNSLVDAVYFSLNGVVQTATLSSAGKTTNWSGTAVMTPGTNVLTAWGVDNYANTSAVATVMFFYHVPSLFTLNVNGLGTVIPKTNTAFGQVPQTGAMLYIGRSYQLVALESAAPQQILSNWTFSVNNGPVSELTSNVLKLTFTMQSNLVLNANFITNPFLKYQGAFNGLFYETNGIRHQSAGYISMKVTPKLGISGKIYVDGDSHSIGGKLAVDGSYHKLIDRTKKHLKGNLNLDLQVNFNASNTVTGTLTATNWTAEVLADRNVWTNAPGQLAVAYTNSYVWALPGFTNPAAGPAGFSYAAVTVSTLGKAKLTGRLADGNTISQSAIISQDGDWPIWVGLYRDRHTNNLPANKTAIITDTQGELMGWARFATNTPAGKTNLAPLGTLDWIKTKWTNGTYTAGFTNQAGLLGSRHRFVLNQRVFAFTNAVVTLSQGDLAAPFNVNLTLAANNTFAMQQPLTLNTSVKLTAKSGLLSGQFDNLGALISGQKVFGVMLQDYNYGRGHFMSRTNSGILQVNPAP